MSWRHALSMPVCLLAVLLVSRVALAADVGQDTTYGAKTEVAMAYRASNITGMAVKNPAGEDLGKIEELVIDVNTGRVQYAVLSFGGILGFGDKLFAVPWKELTLKFGQDNKYFVLDVSKDRLKDAPGFDKNNWPDFGKPDWSAGADKFYGGQPKSPAQ